MLRSSNPILSKQDSFTPAAPQNQYGYNQYGQNPYGQPYAQTPYGQPVPGQAPYGQAPYGQAPAPDQGRMTIDDVVTKTAVTIGTLIVTAALAWMFVPTPLYFPALILSALVGFVAVLVVSFRRNVSPGMVLFYAAVEGVFIGMISKIFEAQWAGIVTQAVIATFVAAGVTLAAYKFFNIRVTARFRKVVVLSTIAFAVLMLGNFVFSLITGSAGLRNFGALGLAITAFAIVLAVLNLILDFDYVEQGVAMGAPAKESWRAAFGLTVTMVWLYVEMLRLIAILRGSD